MKSQSLPPVAARARQLAAAVVVLLLAAGAAGGGDGAQASVAPARLDPGSRLAQPPLAGDDGDGTGDRDRHAGPGAGLVVDLEPVDPEAEPLTGTRLEHPAVRLRGEAAAGADTLAAARAVEGVSLATAVVVGSLTLVPGDAEMELEVAAVDPEDFRLLTPQVTAEAVDVWRRISEGDAAFVHEVGYDLQHEHGVDLGDRVPLAGGDGEGAAPTSGGDHGGGFADDLVLGGRERAPSAPGGEFERAEAGETLRIGAYASNGAPPLADVIVSHEAAEALGLGGDPVILVALEDEADPEEVAGALADVAGLEAEVVSQPAARRAFLSGGESREAFEPFTYVSLGDGMIQIEREWVQRNIVTAQVPVFGGHVTCHRLMIPQLRGALQEVEDRGLAHLIDPGQYGGCWVPRHILFNPRRALSMHAWGLAIDFNVSTNQYGAHPQLDRRIVEIFERWGFDWGGHWSTPDGMHFELAVLLDPGEG